MATKKKHNPAECDRWDTIPGTTKTTSKPTKEQKESFAKFMSEQNAKLASGKKSGKAKK